MGAVRTGGAWKCARRRAPRRGDVQALCLGGRTGTASYGLSTHRSKTSTRTKATTLLFVILPQQTRAQVRAGPSAVGSASGEEGNAHHHNLNHPLPLALHRVLPRPRACALGGLPSAPTSPSTTSPSSAFTLISASCAAEETETKHRPRLGRPSLAQRSRKGEAAGGARWGVCGVESSAAPLFPRSSMWRPSSFPTSCWDL